MHLVSEPQALPLLLQRGAIRAVPDDVEAQVVPLPGGLGKDVQHKVIALLVAEPPQGDQVQAIVVQLQIRAILRHFSVDLPHIDVVLDNGKRFIHHTGHDPEGFLQRPGHGHKAVIILELSLERPPEHPVLPLVLQFYPHVVVDPHDPLLCRHRQRTHGAGALVGVKVHRQVVAQPRREIVVYALFGQLEGQEGPDPGNGLEIADVQLLGKIMRPELGLLR